MQGKVQQILDEVGKVIRGKDEASRLVLTAILANDFGGGVFPGYGADGETSAVYP